jgi:hypothetical protein
MRSVSVVLPESMCALIPILRIKLKSVANVRKGSSLMLRLPVTGLRARTENIEANDPSAGQRHHETAHRHLQFFQCS